MTRSAVSGCAHSADRSGTQNVTEIPSHIRNTNLNTYVHRRTEEAVKTSAKASPLHRNETPPEDDATFPDHAINTQMKERKEMTSKPRQNQVPSTRDPKDAPPGKKERQPRSPLGTPR
ncbi:unnamed protein product [Lota lota]